MSVIVRNVMAVALMMGLLLNGTASGAVSKEDMFWQSVKRSDVLEEYRVYVEQFPKGKHIGDALRRIEQLEAESKPGGLLNENAAKRDEEHRRSKSSTATNFVPAQLLEQKASQEYEQLLTQAAAKTALAPEGHPQLQRLRGISKRMIPFSGRWNRRAETWKWEVNLIGSRQVNAISMPGGKIVVFTGILDTLKPTDDEVAAILGVEFAHCVREHARERIGSAQINKVGANILGELMSDGQHADAFRAGAEQKLSQVARSQVLDADTVGMEVMALAGYDPRAMRTFLEKLFATKAYSKQAIDPSYPVSNIRLDNIEQRMPEMMQIYDQTRNRK